MHTGKEAHSAHLLMVWNIPSEQGLSSRQSSLA